MHKIHLLNLEPAVAVFGSARISVDHHHYIAAHDICKQLSKSGINVLTGGGPGIMEAANKGAYEGGNGISVGFKIEIPKYEEDLSVERWHHITVRNDLFHFRQTALIENADRYMAFAGGVGTEFEIYNVITLMQTGFLPRSTICLFGSKQWKTFDARMKEMAKFNLVTEEDLGLYKIVNTYHEAIETLDLINSNA